jgi:hypothetical protein
MSQKGRPYFQVGIAKLESIFEAAASDPTICEALIDELSHRSTERSAALLARVQQALMNIQPPAASNTPMGTLAAWTAVEALSPQTYRDPADLVDSDTRRVARFTGGDLPWFRGERSPPDHRLYYQVVLGCIPVDRATDELIKTFGGDEERGPREREKAALAAVLVDRNGLLLDENAVAISSFGWALPVALGGDLRGLGGWTTAERRLVDALRHQLVQTDREGNPLPLDASTLQRTFQWLVAALKLPAGLYEEPSFALRVFHHFKSKSPPEVALLNSFFLGDLARASELLEQAEAGRALSRYLGATPLTQSANLLEATTVIEELIAPAMTPSVRWPAPGGHPLVTLQQAAVNAARTELAHPDAGIVAVNGPPGTGKTTLLRDVVAACVLDRASAMAKFDDPATAFKATGQKVAAGDRAFLHLYSLNESLKGHEVVVASSNNSAVENISKELPSLKAIGRDLTYFRTVSDRLLSKAGDDGEPVKGEPTWGLIAAVLGNALNRRKLQQALWWDQDKSLRLYLKGAKGDAVAREFTDEAGRIVRREIPAIVQAEAPPTPAEAKLNWRKARARFTALRAEVEADLRSLEEVRQRCLALPPARETTRLAQVASDNAALDKAVREAAASDALRTQRAAEADEQAATRQERHAFAERPGWLHRVFNTQRTRRWQSVHAPLATALADMQERCADATAASISAKQAVRQAEAAWRSVNEALAAAQAAQSALERAIDPHRQRLGDRLVDDQFFARGHERWNVASPWLPDVVHRKREDLFAAALELHRAFIDVAAQKVAHNLGALMGAMHAGAFHDEARKALLGDLWSTLFLVCPVVSTTFASVHRMLGDLAPASLGWVLVDEAGQATPQSAVGLLMRARKAIIVGDPLQIPPVVSLPQRLVVEVAKHFGVTPAQWMAPEASVQTLGDQASRLKAEFRADVGVREVGIPLLVHRRCQDPMFGIANRIAYDGQMVHAAGRPAEGPVTRTLGPSKWLDIDAPAETKWCPAEGEAVVQLLSMLAAAGVQQPDMYVITPFRIVAQELRRRIKQESRLLQRLGVDADDWVTNRVGTIHTFQGKEAESVIAVLGAPLNSQQGARRWAASTPNIFNVMVTRAKHSIYIVGSRAAWSTVGHGKAVAAAVPS